MPTPPERSSIRERSGIGYLLSDLTPTLSGVQPMDPAGMGQAMSGAPWTPTANPLTAAGYEIDVTPLTSDPQEFLQTPIRIGNKLGSVKLSDLNLADLNLTGSYVKSLKPRAMPSLLDRLAELRPLVRLVDVLAARGDRSATLHELVDATGMSFDDLRQRVDELSKADVVKVTPERYGNHKVELAESAQQALNR